MEPPHIRDFFFLDTATCESLPKFVLVRGKFSDTSSLPDARYMWIKAFIKQLGTKHMSGVLSPGGLNFRRQSKLLHAERRPFAPRRRTAYFPGKEAGSGRVDCSVGWVR